MTYDTCVFTYGFQSTLSMRRATQWLSTRSDAEEISSHALHEESDLISREAGRAAGGRISIHALHEESDAQASQYNYLIATFQSTLSMRRATVQLDIFVRFLRRKPAA